MSGRGTHRERRRPLKPDGNMEKEKGIPKLYDEVDIGKRVDKALKWNDAISSVLAEYLGQEVAQAVENGDKEKFENLLSSAYTLFPASRSSPHRGTPNAAMGSEDADFPSRFNMQEDIQNQTPGQQAKAPQKMMSITEVSKAKAETLSALCEEWGLECDMESPVSVTTAVIQHILEQESSVTIGDRSVSEMTTEPIRSERHEDRGFNHSAYSGRIRLPPDDDVLLREREKARVTIAVKKEVESYEKIRKIMALIWNSLWLEMRTKLSQPENKYWRAVEKNDIIEAIRIINEYNLYGINSTRDENCGYVIDLRESVQEKLRTCIQGDTEKIEAYNRRYAQLAYLSVYVKAGWTGSRIILQYLRNISDAFGYKKIEWQDVDSEMRKDKKLPQVMSSVTLEWQNLVSRHGITRGARGKFQPSNIASIVKLVTEEITSKDTHRARGSDKNKEPPKQKSICKYFALGTCKYGNKCRQLHETPSDKTVTVTTKADKEHKTCLWCHQTKHDSNHECEAEKKAARQWRKEHSKESEPKTTTKTPFNQKPKHKAQVVYAREPIYSDDEDSSEFSSTIVKSEDETIARCQSSEPYLMSDSGASLDIANTNLLTNITEQQPFSVKDFRNNSTEIKTSGTLKIDGMNLGEYSAHEHVKGAIQSFSKTVASRHYEWIVDPFARYKILRGPKGVQYYIIQDRRGTFTRPLNDVATKNTYEDFQKDFQHRFPGESPDNRFWTVRDMFKRSSTFVPQQHSQLKQKAAQIVYALHQVEDQTAQAMTTRQQSQLLEPSKTLQPTNLQTSTPKQKKLVQKSKPSNNNVPTRATPNKSAEEQSAQQEPIQPDKELQIEEEKETTTTTNLPKENLAEPRLTIEEEEPIPIEQQHAISDKLPELWEQDTDVVVDPNQWALTPPKIRLKLLFLRELHHRTGSQRDAIFAKQLQHVFRSKKYTPADVQLATDLLGPNEAYIRSRCKRRSKFSGSSPNVTGVAQVFDWDIVHHENGRAYLQYSDRFDGYLTNIPMQDESAESLEKAMQTVRANYKALGHADKMHIGKSDNASVLKQSSMKTKLMNQFNINLLPRASYEHGSENEGATNAFRQTHRAFKASSVHSFLDCMIPDIIQHTTDIYNMKPNAKTGTTSSPFNLRHNPINIEDIRCKPGDLVVYWTPETIRDKATKRNKDPDSDINAIQPALTKDRNALPGKYGIACRQHFDIPNKFSVYDIEKGTMVETGNITVIQPQKRFIKLMNRRMIEEQMTFATPSTPKSVSTDKVEIERVVQVKGSLKPDKLYATRWRVYWTDRHKPEWVSIDEVWGTEPLRQYLDSNPDIKRKLPEELPRRVVDTTSANAISFGDVMYIHQDHKLPYCYFARENDERDNNYYFGEHEIDPTINLLTKDQVVQKYGFDHAESTVFAELKSVIDRQVIDIPTPGAPEFTEVLRMNGHYEEKRDPASKDPDKIKFRACLNGKPQKVKRQHTASPTARSEHVNAVLCASIVNGYTINVGDVPAAFLNADADYKDGASYGVIIPKQYVPIVLKIKPEWKSHVKRNGTLVLALKKAWYGAKEAALWFYLDISTYLMDLGYTRTVGDPCIFDMVTAEQDHSVLVLHVDDILFAGSNAQVNQNIREKLESKYGALKWQEGTSLKYLGQHIQVDYSERTIVIDQFKYIAKLLDKFKPSGIAKTPSGKDFFDLAPQSKATPMCSKFFRSLVMSISFLAQRTFPEILKEVGFLATKQQLPNLFDYEKAQRVINYINYRKDRPLVLKPTNMKLTAYADASYGIHVPDLKSHGGTTIMLGGAPVMNKSKKIPQRTTSSCHAETIQLYQCTNQVLSLHSLIKELRFKLPVEDRPTIYQDNQSTIRLSEPGFHNKSVRSRNFQIQYFYVREAVEQKLIKIKYLQTQDMVADLHTKPLQGKTFVKFRDILLGTTLPISPSDSTTQPK